MRRRNHVVLINIDAEYVAAVNANGLVLESDAIERVVDVHAVTSSDNLGPVDLILVLVKSFDTAEAMRASMNFLGPETMVISLQNGLGQEEVLAEIVGRDNVIAGKTYIGGMMTAPSRVVAGVTGKNTIIGAEKIH